MERRFCQSCGMPLGDETLLETESSGNIVFIASKRALSPQDCTMEEMAGA